MAWPNAYKKALERFEEAVRADAWKGAQHPGDIPGIERELVAAREALVKKLQRNSNDQTARLPRLPKGTPRRR